MSWFKKTARELIILIFLSLLPAFVYSQPPASLSGTINIYTPVTSIDTTSCKDKVVVTSTVGFAVGDSVLIIQMKGAAIDSSNSASFGSITNNGLRGAGKYEIAAITAINGNIVTLNGNLVNQYYTSGFVQLVWIPCYVNANITNTLTCQPWNGSTGGVLILSVQNNLNFTPVNGIINVQGRGFRGGTISNNPDGACGGGSPSYYYDVNQPGFSWVSGGAEKGEGIGTVASTKRAGKGPLGNGGGGGNKHNTGGGGGSNYTSGGQGGNELSGCTGGNGGLGGISLATYYPNNHLFLGGGGGCGDDNNGSGSTGENGGAIVIITAGSITGNNQLLNANGNSVIPLGGAALDGAGGGGGGGTIFIKAGSVSSLTLTAMGGNGGNQNGGACVGTGGGGGSGILLTSLPTLAGMSGLLLPGAAGSFVNNACGGGNYFATPGAPNNVPGLTSQVLVHTPNSMASTLNVAGTASACAGQSLQLNASAGWSSYTWAGPLFVSNLQNPVINPVTPANGGNYTLTVTNAGCQATQVITVTIIPLVTPTISITNPCLGQTMLGSSTASLLPGVTSTWSGPNGFSSALGSFAISPVTAAMSGVYSLTASLNGCTSTAMTNVVVSSVNAPTVGLSSPLCSGSTMSLMAGSVPGMSYAWSGPLLYNSNQQNPVIFPASPMNNGSYTLTASIGACSATAATIPATVYPSPALSLFTNSVCSGQTAAINAFAPTAVSYSWQGPNNFTASTPALSFPNASSNQAGAYTLSVTDAQGCSNDSAIVLNVVPTPSPGFVSNQPVCEGTVLSFTASGGGSYAITGPNGFLSNAANASLPNVTLPAAGVYTLVASVSTCTASVQTTVSVKPRPIPTVSNTGPVCVPLGFQLNAIGGITYTWSGPNNFSSLQASTGINLSSVSDGGIYNVIVTGTNGCQASASTSVAVYPLPLPLTSGTTVCLGNTTYLHATGGASYVWNGPAGYTSTGPSALIPAATAGNMGTYSVLVSSANSCTAIATAYLLVNPLPTPSVNATPRACMNANVALKGDGGLSYHWSGPSGFQSNQQEVVFIAQNPGFGGTYTLTVTNAYGCQANATVNVVIDDLPYGNVDGVTSACVPFCSNYQLSSTGSSPILSSSWQFNGITLQGQKFSQCFARAGSYLIKGSFTDQNGCSNTSTFVIEAYPLPVANFESAPEQPVESLDSVILTNTSEGYNPYTCLWYIDDEKNTKFTSKNLTHMFENAGIYPIALVVKNNFGCSDTITKAIVIAEDFNLYVPNAFTPNEDGRNETFQPKGRGIVKYSLTVYDRWGERLFHTTTFEQGWDGTFKGSLCKDDVYIWKITAINAEGKRKDLSGHVTLYK